MARVRAFNVDGIEMLIYSGDHDPPHLHARKPGEWTARVYIQEEESKMIQLLRPLDAKIRGRDRRAIIKGLRENRVSLLQEWEACQEE